MKKLFALASALMLIGSALLFVPYSSYAINPQPEPPGDQSITRINEFYTGTIIKIEDNKITVRDDKGMDKLVTENLSGLKIGDKVKITTREGRTWINPQPEPPIPAKTIPITE